MTTPVMVVNDKLAQALYDGYGYSFVTKQVIQMTPVELVSFGIALSELGIDSDSDYVRVISGILEVNTTRSIYR